MDELVEKEVVDMEEALEQKATEAPPPEPPDKPEVFRFVKQTLAVEDNILPDGTVVRWTRKKFPDGRISKWGKFETTDPKVAEELVKLYGGRGWITKLS